jgi:hypothetical protein
MYRSSFPSFLFLEVERCDARRAFDEADHGEFLALDGLDLLPGFDPLRPIRGVNSLRDDI